MEVGVSGTDDVVVVGEVETVDDSTEEGGCGTGDLERGCVLWK